jgi:hypothetical protein
MNQDEFATRFLGALDRAAEEAERRLGRAIPRMYEVRLHGVGDAGELLDPARAAELLYLGEERFYRIIDVAVVEVTERSTICFVRVSGHRPGTFAETWNTPLGSGPFKQLQAAEIKVVTTVPAGARGVA